MRKAIEAIDKKLYINSIGEMTEWKEGFKAALEYCRDLINESIDELIVLGGLYYVIVYEDGKKYLPCVKKMKLYKITQGVKKCYLFSENLKANIINTRRPDLRLASKNGLRERVFFTKEQAERKIEKDFPVT